MSDKNSPSSQGHKFSTFAGVFTPSILTIFGLIMFMRTNYVVGSAGVVWALVILLVAQSITFATGLSISAVSTNTPVKGGGAYFLISRALGPGFGSSIGVTLFLAQAMSVPFYILGFGEAMARNFPSLQPYFLYLLLGTGIILFIITMVGADWTVKCQFVILAILALAILAFMFGALKNFETSTLKLNAWQDESKSLSFIFAIFFPAVTGIMAGVNMSGDLKDPAKSIPLGTLAAIGVATVVYALQIVVCGGAFSRTAMLSKPYETLVENAIFGTGIIVVAGVVAATLSSALGSMMGAPRVLQALSKDKIIKVLTPFAKGEGEHNEPRRALYLTFVITFAVLVWGGLSGVQSNALNGVAAIITMFFLYTYGMVNLAAFVESYGANPSFRPRFRLYHWSTALFGAAACIIVSFLIDPGASLVALIIIGGLYFASRRRELERAFGDATRGFVYSRIRESLLQLAKIPSDPKNWRPTITALAGDPHSRLALLEYSSLFECNRGILTVAEIIPGDSAEIGKIRADRLRKQILFAEESEIQFFPEVVVSNDFDNALNIYLQSHSIGPLKPNIVMLGWPKDPERIHPFFSHLRTIQSLNVSTVVFVNLQDKICPRNAKGRVDIWWRGRANGSLMVILAYLLCSNPSWQKVGIRILRMVTEESQQARAKEELEILVSSSRMAAKVEVVVSDESFDKVLHAQSADATLVFLGFNPPDTDSSDEFHSGFNQKLQDLPPTFLVSSSGEADLLA